MTERGFLQKINDIVTVVLGFLCANWLIQTRPSKWRGNEVKLMMKHADEFEPANQWSEVQHATPGLMRSQEITFKQIY